MTNLVENPVWHDTINQVEKDDYITGGTDGNANLAPKQLADRTQWLKVQAEALAKQLGIVLASQPTTGGTPTEITNPAPIEDGVVLFESDSKGETFTITFDKTIVNSDITAAYFGIYFNGYIRTPTNIKIEDNKLIFNTNYGNLFAGQTLHFTYDSGGRSTGGLKFTDGSAFPTIYDSKGNLKRYAGINHSTVINPNPQTSSNPDFRLSASLSPESFSIDNGGAVKIKARIEKLKSSVIVTEGMPIAVEIYIGGTPTAGASGAVDSGFLAYIGTASGSITTTELINDTENGWGEVTYNLGSTREILNSHKCTAGYIRTGKITIGDYSQWVDGNIASLV